MQLSIMAQSSDSAVCNKRQRAADAIVQNCPILRRRSRNYRFAKKPDVDNHEWLLLVASRVRFNRPIVALAVSAKLHNYRRLEQPSPFAE